MKIRVCKIDFTTVPINELNKALAFYYGKSAYMTDEDGGTLCSDVDIDDSVINHLTMLTKSFHSNNKIIDKVLTQNEHPCCQMHSLSSTDIELENNTLIFDNYSIECMHLLKLIYTQMADHSFSTCHVSVPNLIETTHLQTAGYFEKFPTQAMLSATLPLDPARVKDFIGIQQENQLQALELLTDKKYALNPVACYHVYSNFSKLYNKYQKHRFTIEGKAHRYEGKNSENGRLIEFNMAEIVFMENESNQIQTNDLIQFYKKFFLMLNLPIEFKTSSDAFFTVDARLYAQLQERTASKIELICNLDNKTLAIGSINTHHDFFSKRFNLTNRYGVISTKCTGIGIERLLIALYSYHSNNVKELLIHAYSSLNK
ncbi:MAG: hypothetical protein A3I12_03725 [Gammaproteobacteria bacterium RIFCSPLOWO2_02_FULL_38_11]|nr:MAG: hypothetical protein A3B69_02500 [Gammaproteobacteria bacterium RIFCSPHIGHO2_02_FULL_38_33]OGT23936.1 MAG: hypothetical protein A2W47_01770 [Gammaproteobacteria bacterium RIFCSPHIGHO2_12_38_15]OGT67758.1 MAG: hypothetical protein A3I12_03725 [Gammaproteobacteria bacterium RIFCSPLOWO2_02_FULL_38_11]